MSFSDEEIELKRLLDAAQSAIKDNRLKNLSHFVKAMEDRLKILEASSSGADVAKYRSDVNHVKRLVTAQSQPSLAQTLSNILLMGVPRNVAHQQLLTSRESEARNVLLSTDSSRSKSLPKAMDISPSSKEGFAVNSREAKGKTKEKDSSKTSGKTSKQATEESIKALLQRQEDERESLTTEMVTMAQDLKQIHLRTRDQLMIDSKNMAALDQALDANTASTIARKKAVEELLETSWANTWMYWTIIVLVSFSFSGMYVFMKIFPR